MDTKIKICGLKSLKEISIINKYPVDYVGFIFANSRRKVNVELAKKMKELLNNKAQAVGVFVDMDPDKINEIVKYCNLDIVQMHGKESASDCEKIIVSVWKAVSMKDEKCLDYIDRYKEVSGFLLDSAVAGSGKTFNWDWASDFASKHYSILAGGLNENNVQQGIKIVKPQVVDVSSGVELNGFKNEEKIVNFIRKVKEYEE